VSQSDNRAVSERTAAPVPASKPVAVPPAPVASPKPAEPRSAAEIERDIEATRERLAVSIDELADRVSPKNVAKRGVEKAKLTVVDETGAPRTTRLAAVGAAVAAIAGIVLWRRRG
jgi:hypothetical protein